MSNSPDGNHFSVIQRGFHSRSNGLLDNEDDATRYGAAMFNKSMHDAAEAGRNLETYEKERKEIDREIRRKTDDDEIEYKKLKSSHEQARISLADSQASECSAMKKRQEKENKKLWEAKLEKEEGITKSAKKVKFSQTEGERYLQNTQALLARRLYDQTDTPTVQEPTVQEPTLEEPNLKKPTEPTLQEPAAQEPTVLAPAVAPGVDPINADPDMRTDTKMPEVHKHLGEMFHFGRPLTHESQLRHNLQATVPGLIEKQRVLANASGYTMSDAYVNHVTNSMACEDPDWTRYHKGRYKMRMIRRDWPVDVACRVFAMYTGMTLMANAPLPYEVNTKHRSKSEKTTERNAKRMRTE